MLDIPCFYVGLTDDVKAQLQKLEKQNVSSIIIDLRSNGGGALTEAVSLSGLFIPSGPVVQVRIIMAKCAKTATTMAWFITKGRWWCWLTALAPRRLKSSPQRCRTMAAR